MKRKIGKTESRMNEIVFWERTIGSDFPPYMSSIPLKEENQENVINWLPFEQDGFEFGFSEDVHSNGCCATMRGKPGQCKVTFYSNN